jgi:2-amino-4-hydroxy-6-hydroxymethyldihydropteridine diphosphokinase
VKHSAQQRMVLGLGANLGHPFNTFDKALREIEMWSEILEHSRAYRTAPIGGPAQPDYVNAAILLCCALPADDVLQRLLTLEQQLGRQRQERWGPRTLDLDILWVQDTAVDVPGLHIPHARLTQRAFALMPLLDVVPEAWEPVTGRPYTRYLARLQGQQIALEPHPPAPWR